MAEDKVDDHVCHGKGIRQISAGQNMGFAFRLTDPGS